MSSSPEVDLNIVGGTIVTPTGSRRAGLSIDGGVIVAVCDDALLPPARATRDAKGLHVIPGLVDSEAHPGCYSPLGDDLPSESRAAVTAGVTTWGIHAPSTRMGAPDFVEFVQPEDVCSFHDVIDHFTARVEADSAVDVFATYMLETDQQAEEIPEYAREHGVTSYKLYLQSMSPEAEPFWPGRRAGLGHGFDDGVVLRDDGAGRRPRRAGRRVHALRELGDRPDLRQAAARRRPYRLGRLVGSLAPLARGQPHPHLRPLGRR